MLIELMIDLVKPSAVYRSPLRITTPSQIGDQLTIGTDADIC
jgi:hypothetical protein